MAKRVTVQSQLFQRNEGIRSWLEIGAQMALSDTPGSVQVLNLGGGDFQMKFDTDGFSNQEVARAGDIIYYLRLMLKVLGILLGENFRLNE
ncbi:MAG: hypothetical protein WC794_06065 [Candidatus Doudnabacteria bacterium]|jgi:hypothetical protein